MKNVMNMMVQYFENVPERVRKRKYSIWLLFLAATILFAFGINRATFDMSIEGWFKSDDPLIVAFDWFHYEFGSDDHLYVVYKPSDNNVFSEKSLRKLQQIHQEIEGSVFGLQEGDDSALMHIEKVTSLINAPVLMAKENALISNKLVGDSLPDSSRELDEIRQTAESQKNFPLQYFSDDHVYGGILIETNFGAIPADTKRLDQDIVTMDLTLEEPLNHAAMQERPSFKPTDLSNYFELMNEVKAILDKPEYAEYFQFYPVGNTAAAEYNLAMVTEMGLLNVVTLVIIILLLWFLFRSLSAVIWPIIIVIMSVIWTLGITGWIGLPITSFVMITIMLTLAIGIADTVHIMSAYISSQTKGYDHASALRLGYRHVAVACLLTTITNIVAMAALSITPVIPIKVFSFMCSLGVGISFILSVFLLPLMLDIWAPSKNRNTGERSIRPIFSRFIPDFSFFLKSLLEKVLPQVEKSPVSYIMFFMVFFIFCIYGATQTIINTDPVGSFPEDSKIRQSVAIVDQNMMGAQSMEIFLDLGEENAFHDSFVLNTLDELQKTIESKYKDLVVRTTSIVETIKNSYKVLNDGREDMYIIPSTRNAVSQTLFLFNQSNPDDRRKLVSDNYDRARISIRLYNRGSYEYTTAWESIQNDIDMAVQTLKQRYPEAVVSMTGMLPLMMQGADYLTRAQLTSFTLALVLVSAVFLVLFGSLKAGTIALIPNLIPAILAYGALGLLGRPLDITTMMIAPIIIGIAVDDTVHFITRYRNEVIIDGNIKRALQATIEDVGQAIVFTTLVLGLGFGVMAFASDSGTANLGIFGSLAILMALLNDLFLLPAMILVFKLRFQNQDENEQSRGGPKLSLPSVGQ